MDCLSRDRRLIMAKKIDAILSLAPKAEVVVTGDTTITWYNLNGETKPTDSEIEAEVIRLNNLYTANKYQRDRAAEYPSVVDQLDDIYHNGIDAWKATIKTTKDKYPKP